MLLAGDTFSEVYPAQPESVPQARAAICRFAKRAGADQDQLDQIQLAVSEAVTNAVIHAYADGRPGSVALSASYITGELWLFVADDGAGLRTRRPGRGLGLGLAVIAKLCDDFAIMSRGTGGTELRMLFALGRSDRPAQRRRGSPASAAAPA